MLETLARLGYFSKAIVYAIVGGLAASAAANMGGRVTDTSGALRVILGQPFGTALLILLGVSLCGYAVWRLLDSIKDPDRHGTGFGGLILRIGNAIRGAIYGALGLEAFRLARGMRGAKENEAEMWTARILDLPMGDWLIGIAGTIIAVYGAWQIRESLRERMDATVDVTVIPRTIRKAVINISRFGVGARGVIIIALGVFLVRAAIQHDPTEAAGTRESVVEIAGAVNGRWLLAAIAAGLLAYGVDQAAHAWGRRIRPVI